jgi:hypothetical protein
MITAILAIIGIIIVLVVYGIGWAIKQACTDRSGWDHSQVEARALRRRLWDEQEEKL